MPVQIHSRSFPLARPSSALLLMGALCCISLGAPVALADEGLDDLGTIQPTKPGRGSGGGTKPSRPSTSRTRSKTRTPVTPSASSGGGQLTGTWKTTDGWTVRLKHVGTRVTGTYTGTGLSGTLRGTYTNRSFRGTYTYRQGAIGFAGEMNLTYSPSADQLTGNWKTGLYTESITARRVSR